VSTAIVLFAHGARDAQWALPFERIRRLLVARCAGTPVELAYLDLMQPSLHDAVARLAAGGIERVTVVPLFLGQGGHLKQDLPLLLERVRAEHPGVSLRVTPPIGEIDALLTAIAQWIAAEHEAGVARGAGFDHPIA